MLASRVVLWLTTDHDPRGADELGLFGASTAVHALRAQIRDAAGSRGPILVQGETGSGKELVARALHAIGPRAGGPYVGVNVAAIPAAVAAAELFGHERGAFTGAADKRTGYFERAHTGVVFLDEIGDLPDAIQPVVLRALEAGEIQPIGGAPRTVDVVVVAATDADLEAAVRAGRFRGSLFYRLASTVIDVPPLRARGADISDPARAVPARGAGRGAGRSNHRSGAVAARGAGRRSAARAVAGQRAPAAQHRAAARRDRARRPHDDARAARARRPGRQRRPRRRRRQHRPGGRPRRARRGSRGRRDRRRSPGRDLARAPLPAQPQRRSARDLAHAPRRADRQDLACPQGQPARSRRDRRVRRRAACSGDKCRQRDDDRRLTSWVSSPGAGNVRP